MRSKPERFADHYTQATLFWNSQTSVEKAHILRAFRFELTKVVVPDGETAAVVFDNLGHALEFIKDQYRHCKPILALGSGIAVVESAGVPVRLAEGEEDPGLLLVPKGGLKGALPLFEQRSQNPVITTASWIRRLCSE